MSCERSAEDCGGFCGDGTVCQAGKCVVAAVKAEAEVEVEAEEPRGKKKRRRKGGKDGAADEGGGAGLPDQDGHIPRYRADRDEAIGEGTERLSDRRVRQELATLEPAFDRCLARAAEVSEVELAGTVSFKIGIEATGKVWGVNASLPGGWEVPGLRVILRKVVWEHRFPSWDGPAMGVDYHFVVE